MSNLNLSEIINHVRTRSYMSGIDRNSLRVKATGEVFTPTPLVQEILDKIPVEVFADPFKTFIDPSCGDGQFLGEVLIKKVQELEKNNNIPIEYQLYKFKKLTTQFCFIGANITLSCLWSASGMLIANPSNFFISKVSASCLAPSGYSTIRVYLSGFISLTWIWVTPGILSKAVLKFA